jgi:Fe2+ transport system protein FeoA
MTKTLAERSSGETVRVVSIDAGRGARTHLMHMGLSVGETVTVRRKAPWHGPVNILLRDAEVAIGYGLASKILTETIEP